MAGDDGTLWLRRESTTEAEQEWQVFTETGKLLGRVHLPASLRVHGSDRHHLRGAATNALDVPFLEVYALKVPAVP